MPNRNFDFGPMDTPTAVDGELSSIEGQPIWEEAPPSLDALQAAHEQYHWWYRAGYTPSLMVQEMLVSFEREGIAVVPPDDERPHSVVMWLGHIWDAYLKPEEA